MRKYIFLFTLFLNSAFVFAQSKTAYSEHSLNILGFDGNSNSQTVEKFFQQMNIEYEHYFPDADNEYGEIKYNTFCGGSTIVYDVEWQNMFFNEMVFQYNSSNKLALIEMYPDEDTPFIEVKKLFDNITSGCPKRRTASYHLGLYDGERDLVSILIKNGANENESAVMSLNGQYYYEFFFHGGQLKDYSELDSW